MLDNSTRSFPIYTCIFISLKTVRISLCVGIRYRCRTDWYTMFLASKNSSIRNFIFPAPITTPHKHFTSGAKFFPGFFVFPCTHNTIKSALNPVFKRILGSFSNPCLKLQPDNISLIFFVCFLFQLFPGTEVLLLFVHYSALFTPIS